MSFVWTFLLVTFVILAVATVPAWPYSRTWGMGPAGLLLALFVILALLVSLGIVTAWLPWAAPPP